MSGGESFYDLLGVDSDASQETIERAYRARVKEYHPDVSDDPDARERFKRINRARDVLCDRTERARYDRLGHEAYLARARSGTTNRENTGAAGTAGAGAGDGRTDPGAGGQGAGPAGSAGGSGRAGGSDRAGDRGTDRSGTGGARRAGGDRSSGRSRGAEGSASTGAAGSGSADGETAGAEDGGAREAGRSTGGGGSAVGGRGATAGAGPGGSRAARAPRGEPAPEEPREPTGEEPRTPGRFAVGEAVAALGVGVVAAAAIAVAVAVGSVVPVAGGGEAALLASWLVVAAVAGALAARGAGWLPDEVVRAHAFPLVLFVGAWYVHLGTDYGIVALGLVAYAAHATLFRTAALVAGPERSVARSAAIWFLGSVPAAVLVYATRLVPGDGGLVAGPVVRAAASASAVLGGALVLAVAAPVAVGVSHVLWRSVRLLQ